MDYVRTRDTNRSLEARQDAAMAQRDHEFNERMEFDRSRWADEYARLTKVDDLNAEISRADASVRRDLANQDIASSRRADNRRDTYTTAQSGLLDANAGLRRAETAGLDQEQRFAVEDRIAATTRSLGQDLLATRQKHGADSDQYKLKLREYASRHPDFKDWVARTTKIDPDSARFAGVGNSSQTAITGTSLVNGTQTVATTRGETLADGGTDGAFGPTDEEMELWFLGNYTMSGGQSADAIRLLNDAGVAPEDAADLHGGLERIRVATGDPQEFHGDYRYNIPTAPGEPGSSAPPATAASAAGFRRAANQDNAFAVNALYDGNPDRITDAAAGRGTNASEANFRRNDESAENALDRRGRDRDDADPNRDLRAALESDNLIETNFDRQMFGAIAAATSTLNFSDDADGFDSYKVDADGNSIPTERRRDLMIRDVLATIRRPSQRRRIEAELGSRQGLEGPKPHSQWTQDDRVEAAEIVMLSRQGDRDSWVPFGLRDRRTLGTVTDRGLRRFRDGETPNNLR